MPGERNAVERKGNCGEFRAFGCVSPFHVLPSGVKLEMTNITTKDRPSFSVHKCGGLNDFL